MHILRGRQDAQAPTTCLRMARRPVSQNRPTQHQRISESPRADKWWSRRQSSIASIPSSASSAMRSRICWTIAGGGRFQPAISSTTRSGSVVR